LLGFQLPFLGLIFLYFNWDAGAAAGGEPGAGGDLKEGEGLKKYLGTYLGIYKGKTVQK